MTRNEIFLSKEIEKEGFERERKRERERERESDPKSWSGGERKIKRERE